MKKYILAFAIPGILISCNKLEEQVNETVNAATSKAEQKAAELLQETVNEQLNKVVNSETVPYATVFPGAEGFTKEETGRKVEMPGGGVYFVFKLKTEDRDGLLKSLAAQATADESRSSAEYTKIDGAGIMDKLSFFEKFLPEGTIDTRFLDQIRNDKSTEFYKVKRYPNSSTLIYNPASGMVYQFVEVAKS